MLALFNPGYSQSPLVITGAIHEVMWQGQLEAKIHFDTLQGHTGLFGLGPLAFLRGEVLIWDGTVMVSTVDHKKQIEVRDHRHEGAPFFVHAKEAQWEKITLPDSVRDMDKLEAFLGQLPQADGVPFAFRLEGMIDHAMIHVVDLPEGHNVASPKDAHTGQMNFELGNEKAKILGFFSRHHQSIFTHHDRFTHMHLFTEGGLKMGHLDALQL